RSPTCVFAHRQAPGYSILGRSEIAQIIPRKRPYPSPKGQANRPGNKRSQGEMVTLAGLAADRESMKPVKNLLKIQWKVPTASGFWWTSVRYS
ncbi:unnamed protein product, partial [Mycena citricolor]